MARVVNRPMSFKGNDLREGLISPRSSQAEGRAGTHRLHPLVWVIIGGALLRLVGWYGWGDWSPLINDDVRDYQQLATSLATTGKYADPNGNLISLRPPLYPAMVASVYAVFGIENNDVVRAIQAVLGLLTSVLVYRIGVVAYGERVGLWASAICSIYPSLLVYANLLLSETLFTFLLMGFTLLCAEAIRNNRLTLICSAGVVMALAALTRSIMLTFVPFLAILLLALWPGSASRRVVAMLIPIVAFALVIAPWAVRNTRLHKTLTFIDVMQGRNAMMGNYEYTPLERSWATISDVTGDQAWHRVLAKERAGEQHTQGQLDKLALRHGMRFVLHNPGLTLKRDAIKFFNFWQLEREFPAAARDGYFGPATTSKTLLLAAIFCGSYAATILTAIYGACCIQPSDGRIHWLLIVSILFPCAIHTLIFAHSRYHLPIIPLLAVYSAAALVNWRSLLSGIGTPRLAVATGLCALLVAGWVRELVFVDLELLLS